MPAFVQSTAASAAGFPTSVTTPAFASNTTTGNAIIVGAMTQDAANTVDSVTDSVGNTYARKAQANVGALNLEIWLAEDITGGASHTVTVNDSGSLAGGLIAFEISGLATSNAFDKSAGASGASGSLDSGNTAATAQANEILIGFGGITSVSTPTWTEGASYLPSPPVSTDGSGAGYAIAMEYRVVSATGAYNATMTSSITNQAWAMLIATFADTGIVESTYPVEGWQPDIIYGQPQRQHEYPSLFYNPFPGFEYNPASVDPRKVLEADQTAIKVKNRVVGY